MIGSRSPTFFYVKSYCWLDMMVIEVSVKIKRALYLHGVNKELSIVIRKYKSLLVSVSHCSYQ